MRLQFDLVAFYLVVNWPQRSKREKVDGRTKVVVAGKRIDGSLLASQHIRRRQCCGAMHRFAIAKSLSRLAGAQAPIHPTDEDRAWLRGNEEGRGSWIVLV